MKLQDMVVSAQDVKQLLSSKRDAKPYTPTPCVKIPIAIASVTAEIGWLNSANKAMAQPRK